MNHHQLDFEHFLSRALAAAQMKKAYSCAFFLSEARYEATQLGWEVHKPQLLNCARKCAEVLGYE